MDPSPICKDVEGLSQVKWLQLHHMTVEFQILWPTQHYYRNLPQGCRWDLIVLPKNDPITMEKTAKNASSLSIVHHDLVKIWGNLHCWTNSNIRCWGSPVISPWYQWYPHGRWTPIFDTHSKSVSFSWATRLSWPETMTSSHAKPMWPTMEWISIDRGW